MNHINDNDEDGTKGGLLDRVLKISHKFKKY